MEPTRKHESRNGPIPIISAGERRRVQPPTGFEGMNYEQKRRPFKNSSSEKTALENEHDVNKQRN